jgi:hypothetical protein
MNIFRRLKFMQVPDSTHQFACIPRETVYVFEMLIKKILLI